MTIVSTRALGLALLILAFAAIMGACSVSPATVTPIPPTATLSAGQAATVTASVAAYFATNTPMVPLPNTAAPVVSATITYAPGVPIPPTDTQVPIPTQPPAGMAVPAGAPAPTGPLPVAGAWPAAGASGATLPGRSGPVAFAGRAAAPAAGSRGELPAPSADLWAAPAQPSRLLVALPNRQ